MGQTPDDYDEYFILTADIDLAADLPGRKVFDRAVIAPDINKVAAGFQGEPFAGSLNGQSHTISHLTISGRDYLGLFGSLNGGSVCNLNLEGVEITGTGNYIGGLVGENLGASITNCATAGVVSGNNRIGGLIGSNEWGHITDSYSGAMVTGDEYVAGVVGQDFMGNIAFCKSTAVVEGHSFVGGFVGDTEDGSIIWSHATGSVSGKEYVGGLVGYDYSGLITTSYNTGEIGGNDSVGGLVGIADGSCRIVSSYSLGTVSGSSEIGGLVGRNEWGTVISSYSSGTVTGTDSVGGLVGTSDEDTEVAGSFWDTQASDLTVSSAGVGKTSDEMTDIQTFLDAGWDFETVWTMSGGDYPLLERRESHVTYSNGWFRLSPMKMARDQFAGAVIGDEIFVFGGNAMGGRDLYSGEKYDIASDTWSDIADNRCYQHEFPEWLGHGAEELSGIAFNGKFYVFGSADANYNEMYDPATNTWTTLAKKPTPACATAPVLYEGEMFFFGGYTGNSTATRAVEAYDPDRDTWRELNDMPKTLEVHAVAVHDHSAYIIGGYDHVADEMNMEVMRYDFQTDIWEPNYCKAPSEAAMVYPYATQAPVINGRTYLIGGIQAESRGNDWGGCHVYHFRHSIERMGGWPGIAKTKNLSPHSDFKQYDLCHRGQERCQGR